jgi:hypothetical protein
MGLAFDKSDASWSYSGFNRFRERLATELGFDLRAMQGFGGSGEWRNVRDPLKPLLNHSDCEGSIGPGPMKKIAPRLMEIVSKWPAGDYDKMMGERLARDMADCAKKNERLNFC